MSRWRGVHRAAKSQGVREFITRSETTHAFITHSDERFFTVTSPIQERSAVVERWKEDGKEGAHERKNTAIPEKKKDSLATV